MATLLLAIALILGVQQAPTDLSNLSGTVLLQGTSTPIAGVTISLTRLNPDLPQTARALEVAQNVSYLLQNSESSNPAYLEGFLFGAANSAGTTAELLKPLSATSAVSDDTGHFTFKDLPPGRYALAARKVGYFNLETPTISSWVGRSITLTAGTRPANLDLFFTQGGIVSGRVRDSQGQPVVGRTVSAFSESYPKGVLAWSSALSKTTDDRGEYRLFPLPAGKYFIGVIQDSSSRTFYPGTSEPSAAVAIDVRNGVEVPAVNFDLRASSPTYKISGTALNPLTSLRANPLNGVIDRSLSSLYVVPRSPSLLDSSDFPTPVLNAIPAGARPNNEFELRNVKPGSYDVYAAYRDTSNGHYFISRTPVDVLDRDVTGLALAIGPGGTIDAEVQVEGAIRVESLQLGFAPIDNTPSIFTRLLTGQKIAANGRVVLENMPEARYRFSLSGLQPPAYIADVVQAGRSVFDEGVVIGSQPEPFRIVVKASGGVVNGVVELSNKPAPDATVILVPTLERRKNPDLFKTARTGPDGSFSIAGIMPGSYTILALPRRVSGEPWLNADFLAKYLQRATAVRVDALGTSTVRLELLAD